VGVSLSSWKFRPFGTAFFLAGRSCACLDLRLFLIGTISLGRRWTQRHSRTRPGTGTKAEITICHVPVVVSPLHSPELRCGASLTSFKYKEYQHSLTHQTESWQFPVMKSHNNHSNLRPSFLFESKAGGGNTGWFRNQLSNPYGTLVSFGFIDRVDRVIDGS
jgi:hypothetical protein